MTEQEYQRAYYLKRREENSVAALHKVGSGPLSMWLPDRISDSAKSVGTYGCAMHRGRK